MKISYTSNHNSSFENSNNKFKTCFTDINNRGANFVDDVENLITSLTRMTSLSQSRQVKKKNDLGYSARLALIQICKFI